MQDRFRFRVWDSDNDVFDYIDLTDIEETIRTLDSYENYFWSDYFKDKPEYIMQCTGLKDKNGKLIYEGDIVKQNNTIYSVNWFNGSFCFKDTLNGKNYTVEFVMSEKQEVIGNIYENKDLLDD